MANRKKLANAHNTFENETDDMRQDETQSTADDAQSPLVDVLYPEEETQSERVKVVTSTHKKRLVPSDDGGFRFGKFNLTPTGFELPADVSDEDLRALGSVLARMEQGLQWLIGDWYNAAENRWGNAENIASELGLNVQTLYQYGKVARALKFGTRVPNLSFTHHRVVMKLSDEEQRHWLQYAVDENLSASKLATAIKEHQIASESASQNAQAPASHSLTARQEIDKNYQVLLTQHNQGNDAERHEIRLDMKSYARQLLQFVVQNAERDTERHDLERELETLLKSLRAQRQIGPRQRALFDGDPDSQS